MVKIQEAEFELSKTICFTRAGVLEDETGLALLSTFENAWCIYD